MRAFLLGLLAGVILVPLLIFCYLRLGYAPVATAAPPLPLEKNVVSMALRARLSKEAPHDVPIPVTDENLMEGAKLYRQQCDGCHGLTNGAKTALAQGMYPPPPELLQGKGVTDDPPGETFWKVKNGIRLTGMPAFAPSLSDTEIWQISLLLAHADKLPPNVAASLR